MPSARAARSSAVEAVSIDRRLLRSLLWAMWVAAAAMSLAALRQSFRVQNSLDEWMPYLASRGPFPTYLVVGWERGQFADGAVEQAVRAVPGLALVIDHRTAVPLSVVGGFTLDDFVIGRGGRYVGMFCFSDGSRTEAAIVRDVRIATCRVNGEADSRIAIGGPAAYQASLDEFSQRRMPQIVGSILLVGAAALRWVTGSWLVALRAVAAVTLSQVVLLGVIARSGRPLDMSLSMVPPLMLSLGLSYAAHAALRPRSTGVLALCFLTTAAGIGSSAFVGLTPVRDFALFGVIGLGLVWAAVVSLVSPWGAVRSRRVEWMRPARRAVLRAAAMPSWIPRLAAGGVLATAVVACGWLRFETNPLNYFPGGTEVRRDFRELDDRLTGMLPFQVSLDPPSGDAGAMIAGSSGVRKVIDMSAWAADRRGAQQVFWCLADNEALPALVAAQPGWQAWAARRGTCLRWFGVAAQLAAAQDVLRANAVAAIPVMAAVGGGLVYLVTRRRTNFVAGAVTVLLPVACLVLLAAVLRLPLGLPSLMIGAITVGMTMDDMLHLAAVRMQGRSMRGALLDCFRPSAGSSMASLLCLLMFSLSPLVPIVQFGLITSAGVLFGSLSNLLLLPHLLSGPEATPPARSLGACPLN